MNFNTGKRKKTNKKYGNYWSFSIDMGLSYLFALSKTGKKIPVRFSGSILSEKGKKMGSVAFFQDLREIKRLEKELVRSERLAAVG